MDLTRFFLGPPYEPLGIHAEHSVPPVEPSAAELTVAEIDELLAAIAVIPPPVRSDEQWQELDRLLAIRPHRPVDVPPLHPSVPVIPGRTS